MSNHVHHLTTACKGEWRIVTQESRMLADLRRRALAEACSAETDGSAVAWAALPQWQRDRAEPLLSSLVEQHRVALEASPTLELHDTGFRPNLIVDAGLNMLHSNSDVGVNFYSRASLGTGTTPTVYDSVAITASASGTAVAASASFFTAGMVGMLLRWDSGEEAYIASVTDGTNAVLATSITASGLFAVHAVNRSSLASPSVSQTTKYSDSMARTAGVATRTLSWVFPVETVAKNYAEGGIEVVSGTFLSIFLLSGGTVTIGIGQQARLYYAFSISITTTTTAGATWPLSEYDATAPGGWDSPTGDYTNLTLYGVSDTGWSAGSAMLLPAANGYLKLTDKASLEVYADSGTGFTIGTVIATAGGTLASYTAGSFYRDITFGFPSTAFVSTAIRSLFLTGGNYTNQRPDWQFCFAADKTKTAEHELFFTIRRSLRRVLTNP